MLCAPGCKELLNELDQYLLTDLEVVDNFLMWLGYSTGTVYTTVLQLWCWWVQVQCLISDTAAYTTPITVVSQFFHGV